jgi:hypothetical protein
MDLISLLNHKSSPADAEDCLHALIDEVLSGQCDFVGLTFRSTADMIEQRHFRRDELRQAGESFAAYALRLVHALNAGELAMLSVTRRDIAGEIEQQQFRFAGSVTPLGVSLH